ncbi:hypothetical protein [Mycobacterium sp.]|jgi:hypothetical protein|uniref:hypothetical protein n=1 Tax=Mycobacterium sp. TaxID=1785 RepID=UPI002D38AFD6|nr:hypothetical protein [Mycobacterium sp.]HZA10652.1 hypothetical protein [Mycobacterium sp.]
MAANSGSGHVNVDNDPLQTAANNLHDLMEQARAVLQHYGQAAHDIHNPATFFGQTAGTNIVTTEEIQNAQMKIQFKWGSLIDVLRNAGHQYAEQEAANQLKIAALQNNL